jgi:acyl-CoA thioesterase-1
LNRRDFIRCAALAAWAGAPLARAAGREPVILVLGDSISAGYGLPGGAGWVALLEKKLAVEKIAATVVNASISGDTTAGGLARLPPLLKQSRPTLVIIELGGNDGLRGLPLAAARANLEAMTEAAQNAGAQVLLLGMQIPPNYGARYAGEFAALYPQVAQKRKAALVPFLLAGVADAPNAADLFQSDRIHPNAQAQAALLANVWPALKALL